MHAVLILKTEIFVFLLPPLEEKSLGGFQLSQPLCPFGAGWPPGSSCIFEGLCQSCRCASRCSSRSRHPLLLPLVLWNVNCKLLSRLLLCAGALCFVLQTGNFFFFFSRERSCKSHLFFILWTFCPSLSRQVAMQAKEKMKNFYRIFKLEECQSIGSAPSSTTDSVRLNQYLISKRKMKKIKMKTNHPPKKTHYLSIRGNFYLLYFSLFLCITVLVGEGHHCEQLSDSFVQDSAQLWGGKELVELNQENLTVLK